MIPSSTKSRSITKLSFSRILITGSFLGLLFCSFSAWAAKYQFQMNYDARFGIHTVGRPDTATHRHTFELEQKIDLNPNWSAVFGGRSEVEAAYASQPDRYGGTEVAQYDSQIFLPRDNFIQIKLGSFRLRTGYQQVVWGETFGFYYADIVNPKDYREAGLGDLARNRLTSPMVNAQWIFADSSIQLLYIPVPSFSLLPRSGSDFNPIRVPDAMSSIPLTVKREPLQAVTRSEYGARVTKQLGSYDFSLFYLSYSDRLPIYDITTTLTPTVSATAIPDYRPLQTAGATLTVDFDGWLVRSEVVQNLNREFNTLPTPTTFSTEKSNELIYVLGLDLPDFSKWTFNLQYSQSQIKENTWAFRTPQETISSLRIARSFGSQTSFETTVSAYGSDNSSLVQASLTTGLTNQSELVFGVDSFNGKVDSEFGRYKQASRAWVMFKAAFKR